MPKGGTVIADEDLQRKALLRDMAAKIAGEIAEILVDQRDESLVCFAVEGKMVAVLHMNQIPTKIRQNVSIFKGILEETMTEWEVSVTRNA
jgi:hypothetical protein